MLADILNMHEPLLEGLEDAVLYGVDQAALAVVGVEEAGQLVDQVSEAALSYARTRAADLVSLDGPDSLVASTRAYLRNIIADSIEQNASKDELASNIAESMAFSDARAELIASTEIAMANAAGKKESWDAVAQTGTTMLKEWFISSLQDVCDECEENAAQGEIAYDDEFSSGDFMEPAHPGCRCAVTTRVANSQS